MIIYKHNLKRPLTWLILFLGFGLWSCKVGENYTRPELDLPPTFKNSLIEEDLEDSVQKQENIQNISWKDFFEDTVLVSLIDSALKNNLNFQQVAKEMEIADENLKQSRANFFPEIAANLQAQRHVYSENGYNRPSDRYYEGEAPPSKWFVSRINHIASLEASWEPDIWGKLRRTKEAAYARFLQSDEFRKAVQTSLVAEVATSYYNLVMLHAQLKVAQSNLKLNNSTLDMVQLQYKAGQATSLAITQTESQKLIAASLIPQIERDIDIQKNNLSQLLGSYPGDAILVEKELKDIKLLTNMSAGVPLELIKNRPDVAASELALVEGNARVGITQAMRYPSLHIGTSLGVDAISLSNLIQPGSLFGVFIGSLTQPLFNQRRLKSNYKIALVERDMAELDFRETVINAVTEVSNELITIQKLEEEFLIAEERLENARRAVKDSNLLFQSGLANYLEVITAQSNALESELNLVDVRMQLLIANIELYRSLGGGWQ